MNAQPISNVRSMRPVETDPFTDMLDALHRWNEACRAENQALLAALRETRADFDAAVAALGGAA